MQFSTLKLTKLVHFDLPLHILDEAIHLRGVCHLLQLLKTLELLVEESVNLWTQLMNPIMSMVFTNTNNKMKAYSSYHILHGAVMIQMYSFQRPTDSVSCNSSIPL